MININDYKCLVYKILRDIQKKISKENTYIEWAEIEHVGFVNLQKAIKLYDPTKSKAKFMSFAYKVIKRAMMRELQFYKHTRDNSDIDLFYKLSGKDTIDTIESNIDRELNYKLLLKRITELNCTFQSKRILALLINGYKQEDIVKILGCSMSAVTSTVHRFKDRLLEVLNDNTK